MRRIEGSAGVKLIECTHPAKNRWHIRWDVQENEDGSATYMEEEINHRPTEDEIKNYFINIDNNWQYLEQLSYKWVLFLNNLGDLTNVRSFFINIIALQNRKVMIYYYCQIIINAVLYYT